MLDSRLRERIRPVLDETGTALAAMGVTASQVTLAAFATGCLSVLAICAGAYWTGLLLLVISRTGDGLDGAVARATQRTDFCGFLEIVLNCLFYGLIPLAFVLADPAANAVAGAVLLVCFYGNTASFLAFAIMVEKQKIQGLPAKSFYFRTDLEGPFETCTIFALACLFPGWFPVLVCIFATVCIYTIFSRIVLAYKNWSKVPSA